MKYIKKYEDFADTFIGEEKSKLEELGFKSKELKPFYCYNNVLTSLEPEPAAYFKSLSENKTIKIYKYIETLIRPKSRDRMVYEVVIEDQNNKRVERFLTFEEMYDFIIKNIPEVEIDVKKYNL